MATKHALIDRASRNNTAQPTAFGLGRRLTLADLPSPDTKRWVIRRKAEVVATVRSCLLSLEEASTRYELSSDENRKPRFGGPSFGAQNNCSGGCPVNVPTIIPDVFCNLRPLPAPRAIVL
jgi:Protein of unknown function (DUF1153)